MSVRMLATLIFHLLTFQRSNIPTSCPCQAVEYLIRQPFPDLNDDRLGCVEALFEHMRTFCPMPANCPGNHISNRARLSPGRDLQLAHHPQLDRRCRWLLAWPAPDRKSTRLNSSHQIISYAVFCLKK